MRLLIPPFTLAVAFLFLCCRQPFAYLASILFPRLAVQAVYFVSCLATNSKLHDRPIKIAVVGSANCARTQEVEEEEEREEKKRDRSSAPPLLAGLFIDSLLFFLFKTKIAPRRTSTRISVRKKKEEGEDRTFEA